MLQHQAVDIRTRRAPHNSFFEDRRKCPACASERFREIYRLPYESPVMRNYLDEFYGGRGTVEFAYLAGASYVLCECDVCFTIFQKQVPGDELMTRLYEKWIDPSIARENRKALPQQYYLRHSSDIAQILSLYDLPPGRLRFLDFGMGWGAWTRMAAAFGVESYGSELSKAQIAHAWRSGIRVIDWSDIPGQEFDFINAEQVFEHLVDPLGTLRHLSTGLRQGGIVKISVPFVLAIGWRIRRLKWDAPAASMRSVSPVAPLEHINYFRRASLLRMGQALGMRKVAIPLLSQYSRCFVAPGDMKSILANIARPIYRNTCGNFVLLQKCR